ncbi:MAG: hypothetical protein JW871_09040 [Endomicrobiales bacterium]|nr:hypothetical protein [Endomicrobiales bacterium]
MINRMIFSLKIFVGVIIICLIMLIDLYASPPDLLNYQGRLRYQGQPVSGSPNIEFRIYDADTVGTLIWTSGVRSDIQVSTGIFNYKLGTHNPGCGGDFIVSGSDGSVGIAGDLDVDGTTTFTGAVTATNGSNQIYAVYAS